MGGISVDLLAHMGDDLMVVNAARVSFAKRSAWDADGALPEGDQKLIRFLAREKHWSPFAHPQAQFHVRTPIFVARQLQKHVVGLAWNEVSRRYVDDPPEFFTLDRGEWRARAVDKKQGSAAQPADWQQTGSAANLAARAAGLYAEAIGAGVCPEQARMVLPQSMLTEWIWTGSLYAWARVCGLRLASDAQAETADVARPIAAHCAELFPHSWAALTASPAAENAE